MINDTQNLSSKQILFLVLLRIIVGWHFAYEGIAKIFDPNWSAYYYLLDSKGWFPDFFYDMAVNPAMMVIIDPLIKWSLLLIGLSLITGLLTKYAKLGALVMLFFFWLSHPPFISAEYTLPFEGHYLIFDKNSVEFFAILVLLVFPTQHIIGFQVLIDKFLLKKEKVNG